MQQTAYHHANMLASQLRSDMDSCNDELMTILHQALEAQSQALSLQPTVQVSELTSPTLQVNAATSDTVNLDYGRSSRHPLHSKPDFGHWPHSSLQHMQF